MGQWSLQAWQAARARRAIGDEERRGPPAHRPARSPGLAGSTPDPAGFALALILPVVCVLILPTNALRWHAWTVTLTAVSTTWRMGLQARMQALLATRPARIARQLHRADAASRRPARRDEGAREGSVRVHVAPPIGPTIVFDLPPRSTGQAVMDQITFRTGIMQRHFCLLFNGRRVPAGITLQHLGVRAGDTIRTAPRLRGGAWCPPNLCDGSAGLRNKERPGPQRAAAAGGGPTRARLHWWCRIMSATPPQGPKPYLSILCAALASTDHRHQEEAAALYRRGGLLLREVAGITDYFADARGHGEENADLSHRADYPLWIICLARNLRAQLRYWIACLYLLVRADTGFRDMHGTLTLRGSKLHPRADFALPHRMNLLYRAMCGDLGGRGGPQYLAASTILSYSDDGGTLSWADRSHPADPGCAGRLLQEAEKGRQTNPHSILYNGVPARAEGGRLANPWCTGHRLTSCLPEQRVSESSKSDCVPWETFGSRGDHTTVRHTPAPRCA